MKFVDKCLIFLYLVLLTFLCAILVILPFNNSFQVMIQQNIGNVIYIYRWYFFAVALVLLVINLKLIAGIVLGNSEKRFGVVRFTSAGEVNISYDAIKALVLKAVSTTRGVKDINVMIRPGKENINILIKLLVFPDINIPQLALEIQENVKNYVQNITEVPVGEVKVVVKDITSSTKLRVE